jgi:hypothetical protein
VRDGGTSCISLDETASPHFSKRNGGGALPTLCNAANPIASLAEDIRLADLTISCAVIGNITTPQQTPHLPITQSRSPGLPGRGAHRGRHPAYLCAPSGRATEH